MNKEDLLNTGKAIFNFHLDEEFNSPLEILRTAEKNMTSYNAYVYGAAAYARYLAQYIDLQDKEQ